MKNEKNNFVYTENPKFGRLLMVEGGNNTTEIYKVKDEKKPVYTLDVPWWDLDGINRAVKKNEKAIDKAIHTYLINGIYGKIDALIEDYKNLDFDEQAKVRLLLHDNFGL